MNLKVIIGQHGKSVARAFKKHNVNSPVDEKNLLLTSILYGQPFLEALEAEIEKEGEYDNFLGLGKKNKAKRVANREKRKEKRSDRRQTRQANRASRANAADDSSTNYSASEELDPETRQTNLPEVVVKDSRGSGRGQKVKNTLTDILSVVGQGLGIYAGIKNNQAATGVIFDGGQPVPPAKNKLQTGLIVGVVLIVLLVIVLLFWGKAKK